MKILMWAAVAACALSACMSQAEKDEARRKREIDQRVVTGEEFKRIIDSVAKANGFDNDDSLARIDSVKHMLREELLISGWIRPTDGLHIDSISRDSSTWYLTHEREEGGDVQVLSHWEYLPEHYVIFDPKEARKEVSIGGGYDPKNDKKAKAFDPFNP